MALLAAAEMVAVTLVYTINTDFECQHLAPARFCSEASLSATRGLLALCFVALLAIARPSRIAGLMAEAQGLGARRGWFWLHLAGLAIMMVPWFMLEGLDDPGIFRLVVALWIAGSLIAMAGGLGYVATPAAWGRAAKRMGISLPLALVFGVVLPDLALLLQPLWQYSPVTDMTFAASVGVMQAFGLDASVDAARHVVRVDHFAVRISAACSGVEGFVLITGFTLAYCLVFRDRLRFPMVLILMPVGILLSWCFNVIRIAMLVAIGAGGAERLAEEGFHSHAGWLMFTALSLGLIAVAETVPAFRKSIAPVRPLPPVTRDPVAAEILPFVAFMAAGLVLSTFTSTPALWYGLKVVAMAAALAVFWPLIRPQLTWPPALTAPAIGLFVGVAWIAAAPPVTSESPVAAALEALGPALLAGWILLRVTGTVLLVPVVEELFFRGYLMRRLSGIGLLGPLGAILFTAALFAVLHSQWLLAGAAGVLFGWLVWRTGRLSDAIVAHLAANALIAAWAVATGNFDAI